jgi:hypothetical protein
MVVDIQAAVTHRYLHDTQLFPLCGLNLADLYLTISCRLDSPSSVALIIYLQSKLVLVISGSSSSSPLYFFSKQHSFHLTPVHMSCSLPNQR